MRKLRLIVAALFLISSFAAQAIPVTITGTTSSDGIWDITTVTGTPSDLQTQLAMQEWWGDEGLADTFVAALDDQLGYPNLALGLAFPPLFMIEADSITFRARTLDPLDGYSCCVGFRFPIESVRYDVFTFAEATRVPEPGTLALLSIGLAAMGLANRRKRTA